MTAPGHGPLLPADPCGAVRELLCHIGEDPDREGLKETPNRVLRAYAELFAGYGQDVARLMTTFTDGACDEMVLLRGIDLWSTCEHHLMPFTGVAHVAYIPAGRVIGLSKLARVVDVYAKRLQVQERLTAQVADALMTHLEPKGAACVVEATHGCMACRGVKKQNAVMVTSALRGAFYEPAVRAEFYSMIRG